LTNGHYVVRSAEWNNGAGAVTWGNGATGITVGPVSAINSLVGSTADDRVGEDGVVALTNGHYLVASPYWNNGAVVDAGAVTWGNGTTGTTGLVSALNSLVGSTAFDRVGIDGVTALTNGHYVVASQYWDNGVTANVGAVTYSPGTFAPPAGVTVSQTAVSAAEGGATNSYTVVLNTQPTASVTVTVTGDADVSVSPALLTFTAADWSIAQTVTVTAVDDTLIEGAHSGAITHTTASIDVSYHALSVASVSVNITDDELGAFSTELLTNPGFETAGATAGIAAGWTVQTPSGDKRSCPSM